jgi:hypothetical protein
MMDLIPVKAPAHARTGLFGAAAAFAHEAAEGRHA